MSNSRFYNGRPRYVAHAAKPHRRREFFLLAFFTRTNDKYRQSIMINRRRALSLTFVLAASLTSRTQTSPSSTPAKDDYSQEAAVIEEMLTKIAFDNDGNFTLEQITRVRVQTDAGVQQWGLLKLPFQSATQTVDLDYARVRKADGSTVVTPADNIQDLDAEITRSAPFYSDLREKHVAVKGLGKGDILEYQAHWRTTKPLIPGQFWVQYNFHHDGIVLDERVQIKVPAERAVKVKGPQATQTVTTAEGSRIYTWTYSRLQSAKEPEDDQKKLTETALGRLSPPDVQISSFQSWEEVGRWYWNLQKDRVEPTAAVRAKVAELTKGMTGDAAKLHALYSFVSTQYRYIGIAFGIGRYQPHAADDVLTNNYGDCKDKHTLLASLLEAAGITLYPALINSSRKLDPEVPSPAQFDHIIGYLPPAKDRDAAWLDTTIEVAPFGYLVTPLRDKQALVMSGEKLIQLVSTPADPPSPSSEVFKIDGKLSDDGTFEAKVEDTTQGDGEVLIRAVFRRVPQPQWKDLVQQISYGLGYSGTVSEVSASTPEEIGEPFHFSYSYNRKDYPDWKSDHHFTVPGLPFFMPPVRDNAKYPIWLGPPTETVSDSKVEIPKGYKAQTPSNVDLKYNFAEYHASYSRDNGVLIAKRRLLSKLHEVPVAEFDDYRSFVKNLQNDVNQYVQTSSSSAVVIPDVSLPAVTPSFVRMMMGLHESDSHEANQLEGDARDEMTKHDLQGAVSSLHRAVSVDPKFARAWVFLGMLQLAEHQYAETAAAYEAAMKITGNQADLQASLGSAYLLAGERDKAEAAFTKLAEVDPQGDTFNDAAYQMANADLKLPLALGYAKKAVRAAEEESEKIALPDMKVEDLGRIFKVAAYWDTLGWVDERMSNLEEAELYLRALWRLTQDGVVAGHLCHLYKREHKVEPAIQMCRMAISRMPTGRLDMGQFQTEMAAAQENLNSLTGKAAKPRSSGDASDLVIREREFKLPRFLSGTESAEFFVLLGSDGKSKTFKVEDVKFISGSDKMKLQGKQLKNVDFKVPAPGDVPTRFVWRGILGCYQYSGCSFMLLDPATVHSLN